MKTTKAFKETVLAHLTEKANNDTTFADRFNRNDKNIDDCITFILNTVKKSGVQGFTDEEVYEMAYEYYNNDNIDIDGDINMRVVVNHTVPLTEEEIQEIKQKARDEVFNQEKNKLTRKPVKKTSKPQTEAPTLF